MESLEEILEPEKVPETEERKPQDVKKEKGNNKVLIGGAVLLLVLIGGIYMMMKPKHVAPEDMVKVEETAAAAPEKQEPNPIDPNLVGAPSGEAKAPLANEVQENPIDASAVKAAITTPAQQQPVLAPPPSDAVPATAVPVRTPKIVKTTTAPVIEHEENVKEWALRVGDEFQLDKSRHSFTYEGKAYRVGDQLDGYSIKEINQNYIRFEGNELSYNYRFGKGN